MEESNINFLDFTEFTKCWRDLVGDELFFILQLLSYWWKVAYPSLLCYGFHGRCYDELQSLITFVQTFISKTFNNVMYAVSNHSYSFHIPLVTRKSHSSRFFSRTATLWKRRSRRWFYAPNYFNSHLNCYLLSTASFINILPWAALRPCIG